MAYALMTVYGKQGRSISAAAALLRGYCQVCDLTDLELEHLHLLICCRVACSATLGAYSLKQDPGNHYLLLHAEPAWNALAFFWGHDEHYRRSMADLLKSIFLKARDKVSEPFVTDLQFPDPNFCDIMASHRAKFNQLLPSKRQRLSEEKPLVTFVTGNKKKLEEVQRLLGENLPFRITNAKVDLPELQGDTIEIAREKCLEAARQIGDAVITEDTSLCFTALNDLPGPYIKWFLEKCGHDGLNKLLAAFEDKSAYAQTVVAFCSGPGKDVVIFDGRTKGKIVPARGSLDFGWDPIFEPDEGNGFTYAEMTKDAKDAISHRSRAMAQLKSYFLSISDAVASEQ
jgi:inosine triphosphate pyrophosphatase